MRARGGREHEGRRGAAASPASHSLRINCDSLQSLVLSEGRPRSSSLLPLRTFSGLSCTCCELSNERAKMWLVLLV